jgi:hypothetical protein
MFNLGLWVSLVLAFLKLGREVMVVLVRLLRELVCEVVIASLVLVFPMLLLQNVIRGVVDSPMKASRSLVKASVAPKFRVLARLMSRLRALVE